MSWGEEGSGGREPSAQMGLLRRLLLGDYFGKEGKEWLADHFHWVPEKGLGHQSVWDGSPVRVDAESDLSDYEVVKEGKLYREWCVPAAALL
jgi:hypothetical protein